MKYMQGNFRTLVEEVNLLKESDEGMYDDVQPPNRSLSSRVAEYGTKAVEHGRKAAKYVRDQGEHAVGYVKNQGEHAVGYVKDNPAIAAGGAAAALAAGGAAYWLRKRAKKVGLERAKAELAAARRSKRKMRREDVELAEMINIMENLYEQIDSIMDDLTG